MSKRKIDDEDEREDICRGLNEQSSAILLKRLYRFHRDKEELAISERRRRFLDGSTFEPIGNAADRVVDRLRG
jgi:hypothetical protein